MKKLGTIDLITGAIRARFKKLFSLIRLRLNSNQITDNIWMGGVNPPDLIIKSGFEAVLDLREEDHTDYKSLLERNGIEYLNIKIPDGQGAPPETLSRIADWLKARTSQGKKTLVHCNLGRGRAALATASFLTDKGATIDNTIRKMKKKRSETYLNTAQVEALEDYVNQESPHENVNQERNEHGMN